MILKYRVCIINIIHVLYVHVLYTCTCTCKCDQKTSHLLKPSSAPGERLGVPLVEGVVTAAWGAVLKTSTRRSPTGGAVVSATVCCCCVVAGWAGATCTCTYRQEHRAEEETEGKRVEWELVYEVDWRWYLLPSHSHYLSYQASLLHNSNTHRSMHVTVYTHMYIHVICTHTVHVHVHTCNYTIHVYVHTHTHQEHQQTKQLAHWTCPQASQPKEEEAVTCPLYLQCHLDGAWPSKGLSDRAWRVGWTLGQEMEASLPAQWPWERRKRPREKWSVQFCTQQKSKKTVQGTCTQCTHITH